MIGLGIAWRLAQRGATRRRCSTGARPAAAQAMPPPACWRPAARPSRARMRWSRSAARARRAGRPSPRNCCKASGIDVELRTEGTLVVALTADDQARLHHHLALSEEARPAARMDFGRRDAAARAASRRQARRRGVVARRIIRSTTASSRPACASRPKRPARPSASTRRSSDIAARRAAASTAWCSPTARKVAADVVVLAAGAWSRSIGGLPPTLRPPVRPIKGQMLALQDGPGGAAAHARDLGAGRLHGAAPRRPPDRRRDRRGEGVRHLADRRRRC